LENVLTQPSKQSIISYYSQHWGGSYELYIYEYAKYLIDNPFLGQYQANRQPIGTVIMYIHEHATHPQKHNHEILRPLLGWISH